MGDELLVVPVGDSVLSQGTEAVAQFDIIDAVLPERLERIHEVILEKTFLPNEITREAHQGAKLGPRKGPRSGIIVVESEPGSKHFFEGWNRFLPGPTDVEFGDEIRDEDIARFLRARGQHLEFSAS